MHYSIRVDMAITFELLSSSLWTAQADALALFVEEGNLGTVLTKEFIERVPHIEQLLKDRSFTGKQKSCVVLPTTTGDIRYIILLGLGKKKAAEQHIALEQYRRALGVLDRALSAYSVSRVVCVVPSAAIFGVQDEVLGQETGTLLTMAAYIFDDFITSKEESKKDIAYIISTKDHDEHALKKGLDKGVVIGTAVNDARHWIDLPANILTPSDLASNAHSIAEQYKLGYTVFNEETIKKMGMGGLAAVTAGSDQECRFVIMEYKPAQENAPKIALVGKGITFDSGGLSIKPASYMETMKDDMSGAASVIAAMKAIAQLKPNVHVIAFAPMTENLVNGKATKPGDIVRFYNGKTAEIKNTDAEGRLILADALSYAVKHYQPDLIIDAATLTGACAHALGPFFTGLFTEHEELAARIQESAQRSGDYVWRLPLTDDYKVAVKNDISDLCNIGKPVYKAGGTTAACFLQHFVGETPWAHLDIAGTAFDVPDIPYFRKNSATGASIRLFIDFVMNFSKN